MDAGASAKLEFLTPAQAADVEAIASLIIPTAPAKGHSSLVPHVRHLNDKNNPDHWRFAWWKLLFKDNRSQALPLNIGVTADRLYSAPMVARKIKARFIEPVLLLRREHLPEGTDWICEIKLNGYRALAIKSAGECVSGRGTTMISAHVTPLS